MKQKKGTKKQEKRGQVGESIFKEVEAIVRRKRCSRLSAFKAVAKRTGRQPGTVAANYYRVARAKGVKLGPAPVGGKGGDKSARIRRLLGEVGQLLGALEAENQAQGALLAKIRKGLSA